MDRVVSRPLKLETFRSYEISIASSIMRAEARPVYPCGRRQAWWRRPNSD